MEIYIIDVSNAEKISNDILKNFQHKNFGNEENRILHCFSYYMLDKIANQCYGIRNSIVTFQNGKPFIESKCISISHTHNFILIAFSDSNCGVDVEEIKPRNYESIATRMGFSCRSLKEFYNEWTLYEAKYKMGEIHSQIKNFEYKNHVITAVSGNPNEEFHFLIQSGMFFSKLLS